MLDWCHWEWNLKGKYGIWDDDFRFQLYALGIINHANADVDIGVDFEDDVDSHSRSSSFSNGSSARFFRECLHPTEQIQEITRAIKWMFDTQFVVLDEEDKLIAAEKVKMEAEATIENLSPAASSNVFCQATRTSIKRNFSMGLNEKTNLCFKAIRPEDPTALDYMETEVNQTKVSDDYTIGAICILGDERLQDWRLASAAAADGGTAGRKSFFSVSLTDAVPGFKVVFMGLMVVFLPMLLFKIFPWGNDLRSFNNQMLVNLVRGKATELVMEWKGEWEEEEEKKWEEELEHLEIYHDDGDDEVDALLTDQHQDKQVRKMTVEASSADGKVKGKLEFEEDREPDPIKWERDEESKRSKSKSYIYVALDHNTPSLFSFKSLDAFLYSGDS